MAAKIFVVAGHSGTGKDTLTAEFPSLSFALDDCDDIKSDIVKIVPFTNREERPGEVQGKTYDFFGRDVNPIELYSFKMVNSSEKDLIDVNFIEERTYDVVAPDGNKRTDLYGNYIGRLVPDKTYIMLGQVYTYLELMNHIIKNNLLDKVEVQLIYLNTDQKTRMSRLHERERLKKKPNFPEVNRRVLDDEIRISSKDPVKCIVDQVIKCCLINDINDYQDMITEHITILDTSGTIEETKKKFYKLLKG